MFNTFPHGLLFWKCFTMTQYLIKTITHDTGEVFHDVVKARENEVFTLVDAESEEEALDKANNPKGLLSCVPSPFSNSPISRAFKEQRINENAVSGDKNNLSVEEMKRRLRKDSE